VRLVRVKFKLAGSRSWVNLFGEDAASEKCSEYALGDQNAALMKYCSQRLDR
jgi:hypothetical protein